MAGQETEPLVTNVQIAADERLRVVGQPVLRVDARAKVTGRTHYIADLHLPNMLQAKLLLSDHPHARILHIDISRARRVPGVAAIITGQDTPTVRYGAYLYDRHILAREVIRYVGEPVAAVAAEDLKTAAEAVALIEVDYEDLPAVFNPEESLAAGAPTIHPDLVNYSGTFPYKRGGNVCFESWIGIGDVEAGFAEADVVVEHVYTTPAMHQVPIETHGSVASYDQSGKLTVWTGTQQLSVCHAELAKALAIPMSQIRVIPMWIGGGFGGKLKTTTEPIVALLARQARRPVRLILSRHEEFLATRGRAPSSIKLKTGVKRDGTLVAREAEITIDAGGYSDHTIGVAAHAMTSTQGSYRIPNCRAHAQTVYTNNPDFGCMRGYGALEMLFATEVHMDDIAEELGMDPIDLRRKNLFVDGDRLVNSETLNDVLVGECMARALELSGYWERLADLPANHGIGVANITKTSGLLASSAVVKANEDGSVAIVTSAVDIGTGTHTMLTQIAAETLGLPLDRIHIASPDSETGPFDIGSIASRTVVNTGNAVKLAAEDVRRKLVKIAAQTMGCSEGDVEYAGGTAYRKGSSDPGLDFSSLVAIATYGQSGPIVGSGSFNGDRPLDALQGEGFPENGYPAIAFGTHVAEVEVDPETGHVKVLNYVAVHDVGRAINPQGIEGQIQGGVIQGTGFALLEETVIRKGVVQNPSLANYLLPTAVDIPPMAMSTLGTGTAQGPFGAKGIGEHVIVATAPAVANAIHNATGVVVRHLPISPERLFQAIQQHQIEGRG